mmetsp:Transcript_5747/g.16342  ORF Transcript_5747/g.16342 Transcript_5747/m.16342 type:complete len:221 (-) Transcript_5747:98-760(-)
MFGCCCSEAKDTNQIIFHHPTIEEGSVQAGHGDVRISSYPHGLAGMALPEAPYSAGQQASDEDGPVTSRSLSPGEKEAEKARLQVLVNSFVRRAVSGCPCTYFREGTGVRARTQYRIDKSLEYLLVLSQDAGGRAEVACPIAAIQDIYSLAEDGASSFPGEAVSALRPGELDRLLMVEYRGPRGELSSFCVLEESRDSRDAFLESVRVLCIYAQSAPGGG